MEEDFFGACEDACFQAGISDLTEDEKLQILEHECEGLIPAQAPRFIQAIRSRA